MKVTVALGCVLLLLPLISAWGGNKDKVKLQDVQAITLEQGKMVNARRVSAIPQLSCVGGTAGCHGYKPRVVQCLNRGFDGYDVQWECKADMDSAYRFGQLQVSCEGYDYPDDPYVLRGSCGLEYELELTGEGHRQQQGGHYYDDGGYHHQSYSHDRASFGWGKLIGMVIAGTLLYWGIKVCCYGGSRRSAGYSSAPGSSYTGSAYPSGTTGSAGVGGGGGGVGGGPGFWSGAAAGGLMGYLFGNRGNRGYGYGSSWGGGYGPRSTWGGGWGGGGGGWGGSRSTGWSSGSSYRSRGSSGSSSRTTSGFGGTSRR